MPHIAFIKSLNLQQIKDIQEYTNDLISQKIVQFFHSIKTNDSENIHSFVEWGIPRDDSNFFNPWNELTLSNKTTFETYATLDQLFKKDYPQYHKQFIDKVVIFLKGCFQPPVKQNNKNPFFLMSDSNFTNIVQWACVSIPDILESSGLKNTIHNHWGTFFFDKDKHQVLENYILNTMPQPHKVFLKLSRTGNKELLEYFYREDYLKSLDAKGYTIDKEDFFKDCFNKSISASNTDTMQFWMDKKIPLPYNYTAISNVVNSNYYKDNYMLSISMLTSYANSVFEENHIFLRSAISSNRLKTVQFLLETYYTNKEGTDALSSIFYSLPKTKKNDTLDYIKQFMRYQSLDNQLTVKTDNNSSKMKI